MSSRSKRSERRKIAAMGLASTTRDFDPDYAYVRADLRRIGLLAAGLLSLLFVLALALR